MYIWGVVKGMFDGLQGSVALVLCIAVLNSSLLLEFVVNRDEYSGSA